MIRIQGLTKAFQDGGQTHVVLRDLDLEIESGSFLALLGRSGCGKSTLLNCIAGLEAPDAGTITIGDREITQLDDTTLTRLRRDRIGIVFQFFNLLPMLSVLDNVTLPAMLGGGRRGPIRERGLALLDELGLADRAAEMPDHLSGGEQQRVATARALINQPDVLLADEPTGNLDTETAERTLELLRDVNQRHGVTVVLVTHSAEAARAAERVVMMKDGRIDPTRGPRLEEDRS